jgi:hypothetical protein
VSRKTGEDAIDREIEPGWEVQDINVGRCQWSL